MSINSAIAFLVIVVFWSNSFWPANSYAQGLIGKMAPDGTWVKYKYTLVYYKAEGDPTEKEMDVIVRCVGNKYIGMEPYRWIEIEITPGKNQKRSSVVFKILFRESQLENGNPELKHAKEFWHFSGNSPHEQPKKIDDVSRREDLMDWFFPVPGKDKVQLQSKSIETGMGKLKCEGLQWSFGGKGTRRSKIREHKAYFNETAPLGVVYFECKQHNSSDIPPNDIGVFLVLDSVGTDAKSLFLEIK